MAPPKIFPSLFFFLPSENRSPLFHWHRLRYRACGSDNKKSSDKDLERATENRGEKKEKSDGLTECGLQGRIIRLIQHSACGLKQCLCWALSCVVKVGVAVAGWWVSHWSENISWYFGSKPLSSCRATNTVGG